jgi:N-acetylmuramate 1-kinase
MQDRPAEIPGMALLLKNAALEMGLPQHSWQVFPLTGDGSDRRFFRMHQGDRRFVALLSERKNTGGLDENDSYFLIGQHLLRHGLPVPHIYWADPHHGHFLLEDLGDNHLQKAVRRMHRQDRLDHIYQCAVRLLARLHRLAPVGFSAGFCFDTPVYDPAFVLNRELEYFRQAFLVNHLGLEIGPEDLRYDFEDLASLAGTQEQHLVIHRDFQSRNLMIKDGTLRIIDFQGMRFGPPAYDLASLLLDPYVMLSSALQETLVDFYWSAAQRTLSVTRRNFSRHYWAVRLCRNLQVLGAYGYLGRVKGKTGFLHYIPGAWKQLRDLFKGPCKGRYPCLERWVTRIHASGMVVAGTCRPARGLRRSGRRVLLQSKS